MDLQKDEDFEKAWQENRHIWESTKNLAKAMFYAGQAKAQAVQEWISVEDSLPNRQVNVLVASKHNFVCIASLTNNHKNNKFYDGDSLAINSITHWMPLPKPPKSTGASQ